MPLTMRPTGLGSGIDKHRPDLNRVLRWLGDRPYAARPSLPLSPSAAEGSDEMSRCKVMGHNNI